MGKSISKYTYLLSAALVSAVLYTVFLWQPLGGWLLENVVVHVNFGFSYPNILEGLILMLLGLILLVILFAIPFFLFWGIVLALLLGYKVRQKVNHKQDTTV